jgi:CrcB protein
VIPFAIFVGAGLGGVARYAVGAWVHAFAGTAFPWGTILVNVTGSFLVAVLYVLLAGTTDSPALRALLGIGFCGGYTTFSAFSYESVRLLEEGEWERAMLYIVGCVTLSIAAALVGLGLAGRLLRKT